MCRFLVDVVFRIKTYNDCLLKMAKISQINVGRIRLEYDLM